MQSDDKKPTCGPLFDKVVGELCPRGLTIEFYTGFVAGHAEKVWMGAAPASMFRPPPDRREFAGHVVADICAIYGLHWCTVEATGSVEIWMFRDDWVHDELKELNAIEENSPHWHAKRGRLCGIPTKEIDCRFHERRHQTGSQSAKP